MSEKQTSREHAQRARHSEEFSRAPSIEGELARSETRFRLLVEAVEDYALVMLDPVLECRGGTHHWLFRRTHNRAAFRGLLFR
jgi:hypothetical protein